MKSFRERNPLTIGAVGLTLLGALMVAAFNIEDLPLIGGGAKYTAAFSEAGGLKPNDEVRIAGVKVGKVTAVELDGDHVRVEFRVDKGTKLGTETGAVVKIKTILGQKYLALQPKGPGQLQPGAEIPLDRTVSAYDVVQAFSDLAETTEQIDTKQLAEALDVIATEFKDSPEEVKASIRGLSRLSQTIASRDAQLRQLLQHTQGVSQVLADRNADLVRLMKDGDLLMQEIQARRVVIHQLLINTAQLAQQLTALVEENRAQIGPALDRLHTVLQILLRNQQNLERSIQMMAPFVRVFTNTLGNGPWFDVYVANLVPVPITVSNPGSVEIPPRSNS
ncbi:MCE family protein [Carbonactinospora thermoautotrophica]|uniref:Virulence factor Mce family protein n=1 Tax=Carbonactinospora thermoautotrophica TaxID=1469144 RepID=A0A132MY09_9ACTN|nr:MCE family protein [Carbonactinospora thermoautotrophica]KWX02723.1 Virulence factor Mce family protein [Carbonactinospora thermoautotrophica]MCX9190550.1 MCE family protein [Carbonactinospora thermoautotrophica]